MSACGCGYLLDTHVASSLQEVGQMSGKIHWPFGANEESRGAGAHRAPRADRAEAYTADQGALRRMARHDRLIVGGRAHAKKHGLS